MNKTKLYYQADKLEPKKVRYWALQFFGLIKKHLRFEGRGWKPRACSLFLRFFTTLDIAARSSLLLGHSSPCPGDQNSRATQSRRRIGRTQTSLRR